MEKVFAALLRTTAQWKKQDQPLVSPPQCSPLTPEGTLAASDKKVSLEDDTSQVIRKELSPAFSLTVFEKYNLLPNKLPAQ